MDIVPEAKASTGPSARRQRILIVCAANVCRSPSAQIVLGSALDLAMPDVDWQVESAGTSARPDQPMCRRAAEHVSRQAASRRVASAHTSRQLTRRMVDDAGLVLLASGAERASVALLSPDARRRVFTLAEAALMMDRVSSEERSGWTLATRGGDVLTTVVDLLHEQRGTLSISSGPAHSSSFRSGRGTKLDIPDVHQGQRRRHKPALRTIDAVCRRLTDGISQLAVVADKSQVRPSQRR